MSFRTTSLCSTNILVTDSTGYHSYWIHCTRRINQKFCCINTYCSLTAHSYYIQGCNLCCIHSDGGACDSSVVCNGGAPIPIDSILPTVFCSYSTCMGNIPSRRTYRHTDPTGCLQSHRIYPQNRRPRTELWPQQNMPPQPKLWASLFRGSSEPDGLLSPKNIPHWPRQIKMRLYLYKDVRVCISH